MARPRRWWRACTQARWARPATLILQREFVDDGGVGVHNLFQAIAVLAEPVEFGFELLVVLGGRACRSAWPARRTFGTEGTPGVAVDRSAELIR
jgi:hypothetical protein